MAVLVFFCMSFLSQISLASINEVIIPIGFFYLIVHVAVMKNEIKHIKEALNSHTADTGKKFDQIMKWIYSQNKGLKS